jgi:D-alanyl-D-alanine carboxypeptidase
MKANAWKYGFVMSYPSGRKAQVCYGYEPWHYRYYGRAIAAAMHASSLTQRYWLWRRQQPVTGRMGGATALASWGSPCSWRRSWCRAGRSDDPLPATAAATEPPVTRQRLSQVVAAPASADRRHLPRRRTSRRRSPRRSSGPDRRPP